MSKQIKTRLADVSGVPKNRYGWRHGKWVRIDTPPPVKTQNWSMGRILRPAARSRWLMPGLDWVTPSYIETILSGTLTGESPESEHALYDLMLRTWPRLVSNVTEVKNAVTSLQWVVQAAADDDGDPVAARMHLLLERTRDGMRGDYREDGQGWQGTLNGLLNGWFTGVTAREIDWQVREVRTSDGDMVHAVLPRQTRRVSSRWFGWRSSDGVFGMRPPDGTGLGDIPLNKFLVAINNVSFDHPSGGALLRSLAWWWCAANFSSEWLLNFAQLFGVPFRWATYEAGNPAVKDELEKMLEEMGDSAWGAAPEGTNIEFKEATTNGRDNPQSALLDRADKACDLLCKGQTLTTDVGDSGSRAVAEVHQNVRADVINAIAAWLCEILNEQLVPAIVALNFGEGVDDARLPWYQTEPKTAKNATETATVIKTVLESGIPLVKSAVYEDLGMQEPQTGDEVFDRHPATQLPPGGLPGMSSWFGKLLDRLPVEARARITGEIEASLDTMPDYVRQHYFLAKKS